MDDRKISSLNWDNADNLRRQRANRAAAGSRLTPGPNGERLTAPPAIQVPGVATTFWISFLFGIFGLIPMLMHSKEARQAGVQDTSNYVAAFVLGMIGCVVAVVLLGMAL